MSRTDFLIRALTDKPIVVFERSGEILQELKRQGNNLNQAVRNCYFYPDEKEQGRQKQNGGQAAPDMPLVFFMRVGLGRLFLYIPASNGRNYQKMVVSTVFISITGCKSVEFVQFVERVYPVWDCFWD